jgi:hypothetical protein
MQVDIFQDIVTSAVEKVLPDLMRAQLPSILQDLLPGMLTGSSPSPSLSTTPRSSRIADVPSQHPRTPNHKPTPSTIVKSVISTYTETHLQRLLADTLDQASELHNSAALEFEDYVADTRLEFAALREDNMTALDNECNEKLVDFKERLVEEKDEAEVEVKAHADMVVVRAWDRLNMVDNDVRGRCKCPCGAKDRQGRWGQMRRAMSLPL